MRFAWIGSVGVLVLVAALLLWHFFGPGRITVVGPRGTAVQVVVDGEPRADLAPRELLHLRLGRGDHAVRIGETDYALAVTGGSYDVVLPARDQCFGVFDITGAAYTKTNIAEAVQAPISVVERHRADTAFNARPGVYFQMRELPPQVPSGQRVEIVREVPCVLLGNAYELLQYAMTAD